MNPFFRNILRINPQALNGIPERFITEDDVKTAVKRGYKVDSQTPIYLLKYIDIARLYMTLLENGKTVTGEEIVLLIQHDELIDELVYFINVDDYNEEQKKIIFDVLRKNLDSLFYGRNDLLYREELIYDYLEQNPFFLNNPYLLDRIKDYDRFYEIIKKTSSSYNLNNMNLGLFKVWYKNDPSILFSRDLPYKIRTNPEVIEMLKESYEAHTLDLIQLKNSEMIKLKEVYTYLLKKDIANIQYLPYFGYNQDCFDFFLDLILNNFEENIKYLADISKIVTGDPSVDKKNRLIKAILDNNIVVKDCSWSFLADNADIVYNSFINDPSSINNLNSHYFGDRELTQEEIDNIARIIVEQKIVVNKYNPFISRYPEILKAALSVNPYLIDDREKNITGVDLRELINYGYEINISSPSFVFYSSFDNFDFVLDAINRDLSLLNNPSFNIVMPTEEKILKVYNVLKAHNYKLTLTSPKCLFNNPLLVLDGLEEKNIDLNDIGSSVINQTNKYSEVLKQYILNHYSLEEIENILGYTYYFDEKDYNYEEKMQVNDILMDLKKDFVNCEIYNSKIDLSLEVQKQISDLYFANYEENKKFYGSTPLVDNNPYINTYECLYHHRPMRNVDCLKNTELASFFKENYQKEGVEITGNLIKLFINDPALADLIRQYPERIESWASRLSYNINQNFITEVCEQLKNGTYVVSRSINDDLAKAIFDFAWENNVPNIGYILRRVMDEYYGYGRDYTNYVYEALISGRANMYEIGEDNCLKLSEEQLLAILKAQPNNIVNMRRSFNPKMREFISRPEIQEIYTNAINNLELYDGKRNYSLDELFTLAKSNPNIFLREKYYKTYTLLQGELFNRIHNVIVDAYKNHKITLNVDLEKCIIVTHSTADKIDDEFMNYLLEHDLVDYICCLNEGMPNEYLDKLYKKFASYDSLNRKLDVINNMPKNKAFYLPIYKELLRQSLGKKELVNCTKNNIFTPSEVYNIWVEAGRPLSFYDGENDIITNKQIILDALKMDINNYQYFLYSPDLSNRDLAFEEEVFNLYKVHSYDISPYSSNIFYNNSFIMKYMGLEDKIVITEDNMNLYYDKYHWDLPLEIMIESVKNYKYSLNKIVFFRNYSELFNYLKSTNFVLDEKYDASVAANYEFVTISAENNLKQTIEVVGKYKVEADSKIVKYLIEKAINNNYLVNSKTPKVFLKNKDLLYHSIKTDPKLIVYFDKNIEFDEQEKQEIRELLIKNKICYYYGIFKFLEDDYEYVKFSVMNNPSSIEVINEACFTTVEKNELMKIIKDKIRDSSYKINYNMPTWLFYDYELLAMARKELPLIGKDIPGFDYLLEDYKLLYEKGITIDNNPYTILNNIINNIELVDVLQINPNIVYPEELFNQLVDKLIASHYEINEKTPNILFNSGEFIIYALENNMKIDDKYIERFLNIENLYKYKKFDLAKKYCQMGYGIKYKNMFDKFGLDETLKLAIKYGYLLNTLNLNENYDIDKLDEYFLKTAGYGDLVDVLIRINYPLSDEEIKEGKINLIGRHFVLSENDMLFNYLIPKDPNKIMLYTGRNNKLYILAIKCGFELTLEKYIKCDNFRTNDYYTSLILDTDCNAIKYYRGSNSELYKKAIAKGYKINEQDFIDFPYLCDTYLLEYAINTDDVSKYIMYYKGHDEELFKKAIANGYVPTIDILNKKDNFCASSAIIHRVMQDDIKAIKYYKGSAEYFTDLFDIEDKNGNKIVPDREMMKDLAFIYGNDELMKKAILYDCNNIVFYQGNEEELFNLAINGGYIPKKEDFELTDNLNDKNIIFKKILELGLIDLLLYYTGNDEEIIKGIYRDLLSDQYDLVIRNNDDLTNYIAVWQSFNSSTNHERLITYMNPKNIKAFEKMPIDYYLVLKYGIGNSKMDFLIQIIKDGQIDNFANIYSYLIKNYLELNNNAFGVDLFLKIARLYVTYPNLLGNILDRKLNDIEVANLIKLINSEVKISEVNSLEDLAKLDETLIATIKYNLDFCKDPKEIKNMILQYVFNIDYDEFMHILTNYINFDTLDKIISKAEKLKNQEELMYEASILKILLKMLEETVNATNDIESLKALLRNYLNNQELVNKVRPLYYDLKERIRNIYELDANATLTDLSDYTPNENGVIDLQNSEYTIYAHVMGGDNFADYVKYRFNGKVTICVSPISNLGKKLYSNSGVILGFVNIPRGGFIGSSNRNMGSNGYINNNDYQVHNDHFYHLEIKDSSSLTPKEHPETLLYRDGLLPGCIIIRGDIPSQEEKAAQQAFRDLGLEIPFVHTQAIGNVAELKGKDMTIVDPQEDVDKHIYVEQNIELGEYEAKLDKIKKVREKVLELKEHVEGLGIKQEEIYDLIPMKIGGSHDMFKCHIKGKDGIFYLKPGYRKGRGDIDPYRSYAMEAGYRIQSIVNPEGAVYVDTVMVSSESLGYSSTQEDILCSVIEVKQDTTSYDGWATSRVEYSELSEKEMSSFMQEFISDYLLFSYDTKPENFLKDKNGNTFGIDKEQALKFILHPLFAQRDNDNNLTFNTSFADSTSSKADFNGCGIIYIKIFDAVKEGKQKITEENVNKAMAAINRVEAMSDEEYKQIFKNYVDDFAKSSVVSSIVNSYKNAGYSDKDAIAAVKNELYESLLARKNNLRTEFTLYINNVLSTYYSKIGEEVPEWVTNLSQEKKI